jgi:hypothetical protein
MSATPRQPVVLDATVLSNFASTGTVNALVDILDRPATVPGVQTELERGYARDYDFLDDALARISDDITLLGVEEQSTGETAIRDRLDSGDGGAARRDSTRGNACDRRPRRPRDGDGARRPGDGVGRTPRRRYPPGRNRRQHREPVAG